MSQGPLFEFIKRAEAPPLPKKVAPPPVEKKVVAPMTAMTNEFLRAELNEQQYEAVVAPGGPILILAGAGSGKTRAITYRIARLVRQGVPPYRIMALTFTNKAAGEMKERAEQLVGGGGSDLWISTFHSSCLRMLRRDAERLGYPKEFVIYDANDQQRLVKSCLSELGYAEKENPARQITSFISRFKNRMLGPNEAAKEVNVARYEVQLSVFALYQKKLAEARAMDFDDLLGKTVTLLKTCDDVRERYRERFRHLLVDEFQDTNTVQYDMIRLLVGSERNLTVVGDDDQSIYRWRGAAVENILHFEQDFPDALVIKLEQNYRSTRTILAAANAVVAKNRDRKEKKLWTDNRSGEKITLYSAANDLDEAQFVADTVGRLVRKGRSLSDVAVFYRTNSQSRAIEDILRREGFSYQMYGGLKFYERKEVKDILAYFRVATNPFDLISFRRVVNTPPRGIGSVTLQRIEDAATVAGVSPVAALDDLESIYGINAGTEKKLAAFRETMKQIHAFATGMSAPDAISEALTATGYLDWLVTQKDSDSTSRAENLEELVNAAEDFVERTGEESLAGFLDQAALVADADAVDESTGTVKLMTVHISKGLEFPVVFVTGLEDNIFPHARSKEDPEQMSEERRLMYVAMTRARESLYLTHAATRRVFGVAQVNYPSIFLADIPEELTNRQNGERGALPLLGQPAPRTVPTPVSGPGRALPLSSGMRPKKVTEPGALPTLKKIHDSDAGDGFRVGAKVAHATFQVGVIRKVDGTGDKARLTVYFPRFGEKKLVKKFAKLTLV
jgi:DNA helicase-2/ATP-dependent DNA helicase PcrA